MNKKLEKLLSDAHFIRDDLMRKKINLFVEAAHQDNVSIACKRLGVSRNFYYYWHKKLEASGWRLKALEESSRRPHKSPGKSPEWKEQMVLEVRENYSYYGPKRIKAYIQREYRLIVKEGVIAKILKRNDQIKEKHKKARKPHPKRFNRPNPGDCIQMDVKYIPYRIGANQYYLFNATDDCTRWRFGVVYENKGVWETEDFFKKLLQDCPFPIRKIQTDNGAEFTNRFLSEMRSFKKAPKEHILDNLCKEHDIVHKLIPVGECELNGKVERSHLTDEVEFLNARKPFKSFSALRKAYSHWIDFYNHHRMHSSLDYMTPTDMIQFKLHGVKPDWMDLSKDVFVDDAA